ncbi:hypothetical protein [Streptomyces sp. PU_AKi4]|uniref:hypothetical protein n=1 Tax=Streptomyces sp. PU_AKi4 TaxID=2800809 RepID=UPI0035251272
MRTRTTTVGVLAVLTLTLTACSSSDGGDGKPETPATTTSSSATASATPTPDQAAARQACIDAWLDLLETGNADASNEPAVCEQVPGQSAAMYAEALKKRNDANRERMDECLEDPSCTELPTS